MGPAADNPDAADQPASARDEPAAVQLREAAKWLIGAFGAIGAVVAAGIQFGDVGKLSGGDLRSAIAGAVAAFLGLGFAIFAVTSLLVPRARSVSDLVDSPASDPATSYIAANPEVLQAFDSLQELHNARVQDRVSYRAAFMAWRADPTSATKQAVDAAAALHRPSDEVAKNVVFWANYETLQRDFTRALRWKLLPALAIVAFGMILFVVEVGQGPTPIRASLRRATLVRARLARVDLSGADLSGARLDAASLRDANLSNTDLRGASVKGVKLAGVNLEGARVDAQTDLSAVTSS